MRQGWQDERSGFSVEGNGSRRWDDHAIPAIPAILTLHKMITSCRNRVEAAIVAIFGRRRDSMALLSVVRRGKDSAGGELDEQAGNEDEDVHHGRLHHYLHDGMRHWDCIEEGMIGKEG